MSEQAAQVEVMKVDPLRILCVADVCRRTGYSRSWIMKALADDQMEKAPGRRFPSPMRTNHGRPNKLEWREITIVNWLLARESDATEGGN